MHAHPAAGRDGGTQRDGIDRRGAGWFAGFPAYPPGNCAGQSGPRRRCVCAVATEEVADDGGGRDARCSLGSRESHPERRAGRGDEPFQPQARWAGGRRKSLAIAEKVPAITEKEMQRTYELMFIVRPDMPDEDLDKLIPTLE